MKPVANKLLAAGRTFGPYLAIEPVMPVGSPIALLLWVYRLSAPRSLDFTGVSAGPMSFNGHAGFTRKSGGSSSFTMQL